MKNFNFRLGTYSAGSDDEPIYDHVASDDDYYNIPDAPVDELKHNSTLPRLKYSSSGLMGPISGSPVSMQSSPAKSTASSSAASTAAATRRLTAEASLVSSMAAMTGTTTSISHSSEYYALKQQLESSEHRVQALIDSNDDMRTEISRLSTMVNKLVNENHSLRHHSIVDNVENEYATPTAVKATPPPAPSPYFDRRPPVVSSTGPFIGGNGGPTSLPANFNSGLARTSAATPPFTSHRLGGGQGFLSEDDFFSHEVIPSTASPASGSTGSGLPSQEEVVRRTEAITRCIQELLVSAKEEKFDAFIPCSERIVRAVTDMVSLFPETEDGEEETPWGRSPLGLSLADLMAAAHHFESECRILIARSQKEPLHQGFVTQQVIQCAFDIAKSTKQLVAMFQ